MPVLRPVVRACFWLTLAWSLVAVGIAAWEWRGIWHGPKHIELQAFRAWLNWSSLAVPLALVWALGHWGLARHWVGRLAWASFGLFLAVGTWARYVEPQMLLVRQTTIQGVPTGAQPMRLALVSDLHLGTYVRQWHLNKLVDQLNALDVDAVVVAGDWTYEPPLDLVTAFAPVGRIKHPVFAVLGNHDVEAPGPRLQAELLAALERYRVVFLEGKALPFKGWELVGVGDYWGGNPQADVAAVMQVPKANRIVVTHQPDAVTLFPKNAAFLTLAGHTHGGQMQFPWLTVKNMEQFTRNPWYAGRYDLPQSILFVTTGTGFTGLPARFLTPPRVDLLVLTP